jgi:hypothetical protein
MHDPSIRGNDDGIIEGTFVVKIVTALDHASTRTPPNLNATGTSLIIIGMMSNFDVQSIR